MPHDQDDDVDIGQIDTALVWGLVAVTAGVVAWAYWPWVRAALGWR